MTGTHVEFLDEQDGSPGSVPEAAGRSTSLTPWDWAAIAGWTAAVVLGVLASLADVFTYRLSFSAVHSHGGYTAMGRSLDPGLRNDSGTNYAIVLAACIIAFALLALAVFRDARAGGDTRAGRFAPAVGIGAVALLLGLLASIAVGLMSSFASYRALADTLDREQANAVQLSVGGCIWFGGAALLAGVVALACTVRRTPRPVALPQRSDPTSMAVDTAPACGTPQQVPPISDEPDA